MKLQRTINLPRGYLSYSQISLWQQNPKNYAQIYFDGRDELRTSNRAMEYGKVVADALENGIDTGDLLTDSAMLMLPKYDVADQEIRTTLPTKDGNIPILIKPDSLDSKTKDFIEYKTGRTAWTQKKVEKHLQLYFYALGIYLEYKVVPKNVRLVWIETERTEEGEVKPTGNVKEFTVKITLSHIMNTMALVKKVAQEIETAWAVHVPDPKLTW